MQSPQPLQSNLHQPTEVEKLQPGKSGPGTKGKANDQPVILYPHKYIDVIKKIKRCERREVKTVIEIHGYI